MGRKTGKPALTVSPGKAVNDAPLPCPARETRLQLRHRITSSELKARRNTWGHICPPNTRLWQKEGSLRGRSCNWPTGKTGPGRAGPGAPRPDSACLLALAPSPPPQLSPIRALSPFFACSSFSTPQSSPVDFSRSQEDSPTPPCNVVYVTIEVRKEIKSSLYI